MSAFGGVDARSKGDEECSHQGHEECFPGVDERLAGVEER